ncbi:hypothetical protein [Catonella massiliensis]|uniref:Pilus assembly protein PilO n=1 Tax=Catonella massiliensis TaxID=2799636 RepID=A0ABS1IYW3_9FIRM|nr:hypothetical protein [Catonella massiliensis]MBK5897082.1 hypothetical protein [Catonella massiliensis]
MSISERDKKILIVFVGILIFALVYYFPIRSYTEDAEKLNTENVGLTAKLAELEAKVARESEIKAETTNYEADTLALVAKFPSFLQVENEIMDIVGLEKELKVEVPLITVNTPVEMKGSDTPEAETTQAPPQEVATEEAPEAAPEEASATEAPAADETGVAPAAANKYKLYDMSTNINYKGGYDSLKKFLDKIAKSTDKKSINSVSLTFDNKTGNLDGNIVYDSYFLAGSDRPYEEIITKTIRHGTKNIFGTVDTSKANSDGADE